MLKVKRDFYGCPNAGRLTRATPRVRGGLPEAVRAEEGVGGATLGYLPCSRRRLQNVASCELHRTAATESERGRQQSGQTEAVDRGTTSELRRSPGSADIAASKSSSTALTRGSMAVPCKRSWCNAALAPVPALGAPSSSTQCRRRGTSSCNSAKALGHGLRAVGRQALVQLAKVAPGGLADGALDAVFAEPVAQGARRPSLSLGTRRACPPGSRWASSQR